MELVDFFGGSFVIYTTSVSLILMTHSFSCTYTVCHAFIIMKILQILEVIGIAWIYGVYNYLDDIEFMLNIRLGVYWKLCWGIIIPIFLTLILVYSLFDTLEPTYKGLAFPTIALGK